MNDKLIKLLTDILETKITINDSSENIESWDSLNHLKIILDIESNFNIIINHNDISKLNSVKSILAYIKNNQ